MTARCATGARGSCQRRGRGSAVAPLLALALGVAAPGTAQARRAGIAVGSCEGCHGTGESPPVLTMVAEPDTFDPGDWVTFTLNLEFPSVRSGGVFITSSGVGNFDTVDGGGLSLNDNGLVHSSPQAATNGVVAFRFAWQAPTTPGGVDFRILALAADGDGSARGDTPAAGAFQWAFGCPAQAFYMDLDRDGYGAEHLGVKLDCEGEAAPEGYATLSGDCDENNENINPGATEICNRRDDDCNGEIDENAPAVTLWPDEDGDGFYRFRSGTSQVGCGSLPGYAALGGDCDDTNPEVHPDAVETCNGRDDNCDGDVDDQVRPRCGVGWCARYSTSCEAADCSPGAPMQETCNNFDDDCDGVLDNDACPEGQYCLDAVCVATDGEPSPSPQASPSQSSSPSPAGPTPAGTPEVEPAPSNEGSAPPSMTGPAPIDDGESGAGDAATGSGPELGPPSTAQAGGDMQSGDAARVRAPSGCETAGTAPQTRSVLHLLAMALFAFGAVLRRLRSRTLWPSAWHR